VRSAGAVARRATPPAAALRAKKQRKDEFAGAGAAVQAIGKFQAVSDLEKLVDDNLTSFGCARGCCESGPLATSTRTDHRLRASRRIRFVEGELPMIGASRSSEWARLATSTRATEGGQVVIKQASLNRRPLEICQSLEQQRLRRRTRPCAASSLEVQLQVASPVGRPARRCARFGAGALPLRAWLSRRKARSEPITIERIRAAVKDEIWRTRSSLRV